MKEYTKLDLIQYRLDRAKETIEEVRNLLDLGYYNTAMNRLYYAAFYAAIALLMKHDINVTTHAGVRKMLGLHFVSQEKISKTSGKLYTELFDKRQKGDYNDFFDFERDDVENLLQPTQLLINEIINLI